MRRREFIAGLGGATLAWPVAGRAQEPALPVIGYLTDWTVEADAVPLAAFRQGLSETGRSRQFARISHVRPHRQLCMTMGTT
jgi:putative ABC transport system substrate-binding protein